MSGALPQLFGRLPEGDQVHRAVLTDSGGSGATVSIITYGAAMVELRVPDRQGRLDPVILRYETLEEYVAGSIFSGAIVGRIAGRLTGGRFLLDGREYVLEQNDPPNHLHGGRAGLHRRVWSIAESGSDWVTMRYHSPAGEEGYPGAVDIEVTYRIGPAPTLESSSRAAVDLVIEMRARTDAPTPFSPTSHGYFNLSGNREENVDAHMLAIHAEYYTPIDDSMTHLGQVAPVAGTASDLREPRVLGEVIPLLHQRHGDNYVLLQGEEAGLGHVARAIHPASGRVMDTFTDASCLQFFGGDGLSDPFFPRAGFCLECQGYPDGPNHPEIDDIILRPDELFARTIVYRFSVINK